MPHTAVDWIDNCVIAVAFAPNGIAFNALDDQLVHTIIMIAGSRSRPGDHLRLLEHVSRFIRWAGYSAA